MSTSMVLDDGGEVSNHLVTLDNKVNSKFCRVDLLAPPHY